MKNQPVSSELINEKTIHLNYGSGLTPTEELLTQLGRYSFLRFWSHANPHLNRKDELCDLLVVCGDFVILFSDKNITFKASEDTSVGWRRWYKSAITKSVNQINGATRKVLRDRVPVFKDRNCAVPLGVPIPPPDQIRHHRVAIVSRAKDLEDPQAFEPFITIDSSVEGDAHTQNSAVPFAIGDIDPSKQFVHVMDVAGLRAVLTELDTVSDFAEYLQSREAFVRGKPGNSADSEFSLLARFLLAHDDDGVSQAMDAHAPGATQLTSPGWTNEQFRRDMTSRREANAVSYIWDQLIDEHAKMIEGQSFSFSTVRTVEEGERVVRYMALENRLNRRILGKRWMEACHINHPDSPANLRTVPHSAEDGTTYVFLNVSNLQNEPEEIFRSKRRSLLQEMMLASLVDVPSSRIVIGLAADLGRVPESYDHAFLDVLGNDGEQLRLESHLAWKRKRLAFGSPLVTQHDERDIPRP